MSNGTGTQTVQNATPEQMSAVEAALGELELDSVVEDGSPISELDDSDEASLEVLEAQEAAVESQEATPISDEADPTATPAPSAAAPSKKERTPGTPRKPRELSSVDASAFVLTTTPPADLEANKTAVIAAVPTQKKIAEKYENLFSSIAAGKKPSVYVMACFDVLANKGEASSTELVAALKATASKKGSSYSDGTARSQVGQIMTLFDAVKIATRDKQSLKMNPDSALAPKLKALLTAAA